MHLGVDREFVPAKKAHAAFQVVDLDATETRFRAAGITIIPDSDLPGYRRFYVADPFGNRLEFLQPKA